MFSALGMKLAMVGLMVATFLGGLTYTYQSGKMAARAECNAAAIQRQLDIALKDLEWQRNANKAAEEIAKADEVDAAASERKSDELRAEIPPATPTCGNSITGDDLERLRKYGVD